MLQLNFNVIEFGQHPNSNTNPNPHQQPQSILSPATVIPQSFCSYAYGQMDRCRFCACPSQCPLG